MMSLWLTHAIFAFLAWGLFAPLATFLSTFRNIIFTNYSSRQEEPLWDRHTTTDPTNLQGRTWVKIHRYVSETAILFTWVAFIIAVCGMKEGHRQHFKKPHQVVGLIIFLLTFPLWGLGRVLMPPKVPPQNNDMATDESTSLIFQPNESNYDNQRHSRSKETVLIWAHRVIGCVLLIGGLWEIYSGILLYTKKMPESSSYLLHAYVYWLVFVVVLMLVIFPLISLRG